MRALNTEAAHSQQRRWGSLAVSVGLHVVGLLFGALTWPHTIPPPKPTEVVELALVARGHEDVSAPAAPAAPRPAPPRPTRPTPAPPSPTAPVGDRPVEPPEPEPVQSFAEWQARQRSHYMPTTTAYAAGRIDGRAPLHRPGRRSCDPPEARSAKRVYLLFDASGSMDGLGRSQALRCAQQYATAVLRGGAEVVVATFARDVKLSPPTHDLLDVQIALRALTDPTATRLPARELQRLFQQLPDDPADLVIISDGWFMTERDVLIWYRFFLDLNPENRGVMYTVGNRGAREAVTQLRGLGFDVHAYEPTGGEN